MSDADEPDDEWVERAKGGDCDAFGLLYERHARAAYLLASGTLKDAGEAADAVQTTFEKALKGLPGYRGESKFRTWLLHICKNTCLDQIRKTTKGGEPR